MEQVHLRRRLLAVMGKPENQSCCDCSARRPTWTTLIKIAPGGAAEICTLGAFCCFQCSAAHRSLGTHICFVRSVDLDVWKEQEVKAMEDGGNTVINVIFEARLLSENVKPSSTTDALTREKYIRQKYCERKYYGAPSTSLFNKVSAPSIPSTSRIQSFKMPRPPDRSLHLMRANSLPQLMSPKWENPEKSFDKPGHVVGGAVRIGQLPRIPSPDRVSNERNPSKGGMPEVLKSTDQPQVTILASNNNFQKSRGDRKPSTKEDRGDPLAVKSSHFPMQGSRELNRRSKSSRDFLSSSTHSQSCKPTSSLIVSSGDAPIEPESEIQVPDLTPPFIEDHSKRNYRRKNSEEVILVDTRGLEAPNRSLSLKERKQKKDKYNGLRRRSRRASYSGSVAPKTFLDNVCPNSKDAEATVSAHKMKRRTSLQDSVYEIVQCLEKEDTNHEVSKRTNRRMLERRSSLTCFVEQTAMRPPIPPRRARKLRGNIQPTIDKIISQQHLCMDLTALALKNSPQSHSVQETCMLSRAFDDDLSSEDRNVRKSTKQMARRSSMPGMISSPLSPPIDTTETCPEQSPIRPCKWSSLRCKLDKTQSVSRSYNDDSSVASEHSDILSITGSSDRSTLLVRNNSMPDLSKEQPGGQLSEFLGSLVGDHLSTRTPVVSKSRKAPPRSMRRRKRPTQGVKPLAAGDDVTLEIDIQCTE